MSFQSKYGWIVTVSVIVIVWRILIGVVVQTSGNWLKAGPSFMVSGEVENFNLPRHIKYLAMFDGLHYMHIADAGYKYALTQAFFPVYPLLMRLIAQLTQLDLMVVGLGISFIATWLGSLFWFKYFQMIGIKYPIRLLLIWLFFPTAYYLAAVYTEGLFFMLLGLAMLLMTTKHFYLSALCIAIASATRIIGVFIFIPLLYTYLDHLGGLNKNIFKHFIPVLKQKWLTLIILVFISTAGLLIYSFYLYQNFHDPLLYLHVQSQFGASRSSNLIVYPQVVWRAVKIVVTQRPYDWRYFTSVLELIAGTVSLIFIYLSLKNKRLVSLVMFSLLAFFLPTLTGNFSSMPRYILLCPALFVGLYIWFEHLNHKRWLYLWLSVSTMLLLICTAIFSQGYWIG